jgi:hypothetical protein
MIVGMFSPIKTMQPRTPSFQAVKDALQQLPDFGLGASKNPVTHVLQKHLLSSKQARQVMDMSPSHVYGQKAGVLHTLFPHADETDLTVSSKRLGQFLNAVQNEFSFEADDAAGNLSDFTAVFAGKRIAFKHLGNGSNGHVWQMADANTPDKPLATFKQSIMNGRNLDHFFTEETAIGNYVTHGQGATKNAQGVYMSSHQRLGDTSGYQVLGEYIAPDALLKNRSGKRLEDVQVRGNKEALTFHDEFFRPNDTGDWRLNQNRMGRPLVQMKDPDGTVHKVGPIRIDLSALNNRHYKTPDTEIDGLRTQVAEQVAQKGFSNYPEGYARWGDIDTRFPKAKTDADYEVYKQRQAFLTGQFSKQGSLADTFTTYRKPSAYRQLTSKEGHAGEKKYLIGNQLEDAQEQLANTTDPQTQAKLQSKVAHLTQRKEAHQTSRNAFKRERQQLDERLGLESVQAFSKKHFFDLGIEDVRVKPAPKQAPTASAPSKA